MGCLFATKKVKDVLLMRVILIEDKDAKALVDKLKLESLMFSPGGAVVMTAERYKMTKVDLDQIVSEIHRKFHYEVVSWLQDQGAKLS